MTEKERREYNRDCGRLAAARRAVAEARKAYEEIEREFDKKWNPELIKAEK